MKYRRCTAHLSGGMRCWNPAMLALRNDEAPLCWPHYAKALVDDRLLRREALESRPSRFKLVQPPARGQYR